MANGSTPVTPGGLTRGATSTSWREQVSPHPPTISTSRLPLTNTNIDDIINVAAHRLSTGALEQAITSHPLVTEACVVGIPDALKGQMPFAFVVTTTSPPEGTGTGTDTQLFAEIQKLVRSQVGPIASLGGMIRGKGMIPKTRSGKTLRRVLRELLENGVHGEFDREVAVPSTVEDVAVVGVAREAVRGYFEGLGKSGRHGAVEGRRSFEGCVGV